MSATKKTADIFSAARSLYNKRKSLREKSDQLMADADPKARAICESIEEEEAAALIESATVTHTEADGHRL